MTQEKQNDAMSYMDELDGVLVGVFKEERRSIRTELERAQRMREEIERYKEVNAYMANLINKQALGESQKG